VLIGEASIRIDAITADLKKQVNKDLNDALKSIKVDNDPLVAMTQNLRKAELDLLNTEERLAAAQEKTGQATDALTEARKKFGDSSREAAKANLDLNKAQLEEAVSADRVIVATKKLNTEHNNLKRGAAEAEQATKKLRNALFDSSSIMGALGNAFGRGRKAFKDVADESDNASKKLSFGERVVRGLGGAMDNVAKAPLKFLQEGFSQLGNIGGGVLDVLTSKLPYMAGGIAAIAAPVGGLILALPGLAAVAGSAFAAIALGMDGIKKAFGTLTPAIDTLKSKVSDSFEKALAPAVKNLAPLFPAITSGIQQMATALGGTVTMISKTITSAEGLKAIKVTLEGAARFIQGMQPGIDALVKSFLTLGEAVGPQLKALGASIGSIFEGFNNAVNELKASGALGPAFEGLAAVFKSIGGLITPVIVLLGKLAGALEGPLATVIDAIAKGLAAATPGIIAFANGFGKVMTAIAPALEALLPLIGDIAGLIGGVLGDAFEAIMPALTEVIKALSGALRPVLPVVADAFRQIGEAIKPVAGELGQALGKIFADLAPIIPTVAKALVDLVPALLDLVKAVIPLLEPLMRLITIALPPLIDLFTAIAVPIIQLAAWIIGLLVPIIVSLVNTVADGTQKMIDWFRNFGDNISGVFNAIKDFLSDIWDFIWRNTIGKIIQLVQDGKAKFDEFVQTAARIFNDLRTKISDAVERVKSAVREKFNDVVNFIRGIPGQIGSFFANFGSMLYNAGRDLLTGLINGISSMIRNVISKVVDVGKSILNGIKGALGINSPSREMAIIGDSVGEGLVLGLTRSITPVQKQAIALADATIQAMADNLGGANVPTIGVQVTPVGGIQSPDGSTTNPSFGATNPANYVRPQWVSDLINATGEQTTVNAAATAQAVTDGLSGVAVVLSATQADSEIQKVQATNERRR
jgi:phage-related protein